MLATEAQADREYAHNAGMDNPERAWILSNRDAWYPNPFYSGPAVPHPESYYDAEEYLDEDWAESWIAHQDKMEAKGTTLLVFVQDEIPF
jgi:hypothetical protein